MALKALFYPDVPFDTLYIPYIYKEIYFDGVYIDVLNQRKDMVIVDVGANIGVVTQHMRDHAKVVYAVEPSPEHYEALKKNVEFNGWDNVIPLNYAIADKDGEMEFSQNVKNRTMNSLIIGESMGGNKHVINDGTNLHKDYTFNAEGYENKVKVKTKSMDTFFEENKIDVVDFMKFDVEGAEDMILRSEGFKKVAEKIKAIEVEFHFPTWTNLAEYMQGLGYSVRRYKSSAVIILFSR